MTRPRRRWVLAVLVAVAACVDLACSGVTSYGHWAREHVRVSVAVENEIVQVFVDCRLAHAQYRDDPKPVPLDLGWLEPEQIVTIQVRGRKPPGYFAVSLYHGAQGEVAAQAGSFSDPQRMESGKIIRALSFQAGGRNIGETSCQPGPFQPLPLAAATADRAAAWDPGLLSAVLEATGGFAPVVNWLLALLGAGVLLTVLLHGHIGDRSGRTLLRAATVVADIVLAVILMLAPQHFDVVFLLGGLAGTASLVAALVWLLKGERPSP